jgi:hypothetical protein
VKPLAFVSRPHLACGKRLSTDGLAKAANGQLIARQWRSSYSSRVWHSRQKAVRRDMPSVSTSATARPLYSPSHTLSLSASLARAPLERVRSG